MSYLVNIPKAFTSLPRFDRDVKLSLIEGEMEGGKEARRVEGRKRERKC